MACTKRKSSKRRSKKSYRRSRKVYQIGKSKAKYDARRQARKPGRRVSSSGRVYHERRRNRSDVRKWL